MFIRPNIFSLIYICLHSALHSSAFFFAKLPEAYSVFNPIIDVRLIHGPVSDIPAIPLHFIFLG
ncbi:hypothetical protein AMTRI_Chr03g139670 [Amborella trichopoda]